MLSFISFFVCYYTFINTQPRFVDTPRVKIFNGLVQLVILMTILISGDLTLNINPTARHKMSLVYPLSNPAPSGNWIVALIKWDS